MLATKFIQFGLQTLQMRSRDRYGYAGYGCLERNCECRDLDCGRIMMMMMIPEKLRYKVKFPIFFLLRKLPKSVWRVYPSCHSDVRTMLYGRCYNFKTLKRRPHNVVLTSLCRLGNVWKYNCMIADCSKKIYTPD